MKKLTKEKLYEIMDNFVAADSIYRELLPYLADEQQAEQRTKSEPSRLETIENAFDDGYRSGMEETGINGRQYYNSLNKQ